MSMKITLTGKNGHVNVVVPELPHDLSAGQERKIRKVLGADGLGDDTFLKLERMDGRTRLSLRPDVWACVQEDECGIDPFDAEDLVTAVCFHGRYRLGTQGHGYVQGDYNSLGGLREDIVRREKPVVIEPLYLYDHTGLALSTTPFSCQWDSGQVGWIFISKEGKDRAGFKRLTKQRAKSMIDAVVEQYEYYVNGLAYHVSVGFDDGEIAEECGGFLGYDCDSNGVLSYFPNELESLIRKAFDLDNRNVRVHP